jgi:hypothetical protein
VPEAAETGSHVPRAESGRFAAERKPAVPPAEVNDIPLMDAGPVENGKVYPRSVMRRREPTREELGEKLVGAAVGAEAHLPGDGMQAVAGAQADEALWTARERALVDALDRGEEAIDFEVQSTGRVERLTADDLGRIRHRLRA